MAIMLVMCIQQLNAQICNGSLGDPIINITFGAGSNPGTQLSAATTNYQFVNTDCPQDGFYTLRNVTTSCHGNTWHTISDHTGNGNGYFMLVNASLQPSAFYLDTVRGLCGNTTYEFAAWVVNVLRPTACGSNGIQPNLTFRIERTDGTVLQTYNTNNIPSGNIPEWKQYGFFFTTPANATDVVVRIINNSQGGCGNDLALDDITFRACGPQITTLINGVTGNSVSLCEGTAGAYTFTANVSVGFNDPVVQWQQSINNGSWTDIAGATSLSYTKTFSSTTSPAAYSFRVAATESGSMSSLQCRIASLPLNVEVAANPTISITNNTPVCEGETITLSASSAAVVWSGPNGIVFNGSAVNIPDAELSYSGRYYATAINGACTRVDSTEVMVHPVPLLNVISEATFCQGDSVNVTVNGADTYQWMPSTNVRQTSANSYTVFPNDTTDYTVIGSNGFACSDSADITVNVIAKPIANAGPDKVTIEGTPVQLSGSIIGDSITFTWLPNVFITNATTLAPLVYPPTDTSYILQVTSLAGCGFDADTTNIHVYKQIIIPNAFSPNGDAINDEWRIAGLETYPGAEVAVFNRYGQPVFRTSDFQSWNGTLNGKALPVGTYYYVIKLPEGFSGRAGWIFLLK